jgi:hypothetical protein
MREILQTANEQAQKATQTSQQKQKGNYDLKARASTFKVGDRVLVRIVAYGGKHKIADKWENNPYVMLSQQKKDIPVLKV